MDSFLYADQEIASGVVAAFQKEAPSFGLCDLVLGRATDLLKVAESFYAINGLGTTAKSYLILASLV